ncbi:glucuronokinase 1-like isoform X3 [Phoenix dactylifera]|uniref:Glucuronokinase 1-like isoform X3 n=1 Tax=Phoenix dactylifera TaxID=42345 RepID=A0A8B9AAJ3_PHODC|nr:glucuronokinase 1-like isoform X3 [Phoenix dactylifera]
MRGSDDDNDDDDKAECCHRFRGKKRSKAAAAEMGSQEEVAIEHQAYARIGLLGNPSDVYFGRTISFSLGNFWASVRLEPSDDLIIRPHPTHDLISFTSIHHLTGLSGSSAIVCAALNCLLDFYRIRHLVKVEIRPEMILSAETELGIVAGLQDRVAQVYGGLVYMDFSKEYMDKLGYGMYTMMDIGLLPPLYLIYAENPSDSGKSLLSCMQVHSTVRQRWLEGDEFIISSMEEVAELALEGRKALLEKDYAELADLMNRNFELRRKMFGDDVLGSLNIQMVEVARSVGAASKFTGSGGAVVAFCPDGPDQAKLLEEACEKAGFIVQQAIIVPPVLNDEELKTVSI